MKRGYILKRLLRSVISILIIMVVVFFLVYTLVPRDNIFFEDSTYRKLGGKPDDKTEYVYNTWRKLGYLDFVKINDYCLELYEAGSDEMKAALEPDSKETADFVALYESQGYTVEYFKVSGRAYAYKDIPVINRLLTWAGKLIQIDHVNKVQDPNNPDLERKIYFGRTPTGGIAIMGSGTYHKYLFYTDSRFPFIHQNFITLNMGESYPTYQGIEALTVMFSTQGTEVKREVTFDTGETSNSAINFGSLTYKETLDRMDKKKFTDHYANYTTFKDQSSMVGTSFIMGIFALLLAYGLGLPIGVAMARNKDGVVDKLGMLFIIFITSVPSLAYIYIFRYLGTTLFGLPNVFTTFGPSDIRSWILPIISLALPSISSLMLWIRRYVVDQMNADYVKFAKAKGLNRKEIFRRHIFKNASIPIAQGIPSSLAGCITGAIITEAIYSVGGMGKMLPNAINQYNNVMIIALTFLFSSISVLSVLLGDIILTKVDPRISLTDKAGRS
ncbi:MAG: ABC transporter permease [Clostridia bacterium]|nr:ABC transporter permease [Clostridia bacterium]MBR2287712.1 ABC transporter permease [Clostridia bacterium]